MPESSVNDAITWLQAGFSPSELAGTFDRPTIESAARELRPRLSDLESARRLRRASILNCHPKAPPLPPTRHKPPVRSNNIRTNHIARHPIDVFDSPTFLAAALPPVSHPERSVAGLEVGQKVPMPPRPGIAYVPQNGGCDARTVDAPRDFPSGSARYSD